MVKMKKELPHFVIGNTYGGNQNWMIDPWMHLGGCAALTACDSCIYLASFQKRKKLYPFDWTKLSKKEYIRFAGMMKPYLRPRAHGVDKVSIYIEGLGAYLSDVGETNLHMEELPGFELYDVAKQRVKEQIDGGVPIPYLLLYHKDANFKDYVWHWFLLNGYDESKDGMLVKAVTYGGYQWLDFERLWDTGHDTKGGFVLYHFA